MAVVAAILLASSTVLSGCSFEAGSQAESGKAKIRFASWDSAEDLGKQQALVNQFNSSHEDIEVTLEAYGSEYDTRISAGMGPGDMPDVLYMWDYPSYYEELEPLDSCIEKEEAEYKDSFYDVLWPYNSKSDTIYGIPVGFTTRAPYYDKDIFAQAGVAESTNDWIQDDVKTAAKTITDSVSDVKGFFLQMKPDPYDYEMYPRSNGSPLMDANGNLDGNLNPTNSVETISLFQEMEKGGYAVITEKNGTDEFHGGQTAMYIYGAQVVSTFDEDGSDYGVMDIPALAGAGRDFVSTLSSSGVSISKDPKDKETAWEFAKYWAGEEMNKARTGYELPALKSVMESEKILDNPPNALFYSMLEQSNGFIPASFTMDSWSTLKDTLDLAFERVYNPSTLEDPATVLSEVILEMQ